MKKNIYAYLLAGVIALALCGCGEQKEENLVNIENVEADITESGAEEGKEMADKADEGFSFSDFKNLEFWF